MKIYLEGYYIYRKRNTLLGGVMAAIFGLVGLYFSIAEVIRTPADALHPFLMVLALLFTIGIPSLIGFTGFWLLYGWLTDKRIQLIIDESGIHYGKKFQPWENIKWVFCKGKSENETFLVYQTTSSWLDKHIPISKCLVYQTTSSWLDKHIPISKCLSTGELNHLFSQLKSQVASSHPHLKID